MDSASIEPIGLFAAARAVVQGITGAEVERSERITQGMMTFKYRVVTRSGDDIMVRFYPAGRASAVDREPDLIARCLHVGLPVPVSIGDSRTGPPAPLAYVAYRRIPGETLASRLPGLAGNQREVLAIDLVRWLRRLQEITFEGAGDIVSGHAAHACSWSTFVRESMYSGLEAVKHHALLPPRFTEMLERVVGTSLPATKRPTDRLVWGDINFDNVLLTDAGTVAGLIDFEGCLSGDPLATLGYCQAVHGADDFFGDLVDTWAGGSLPEQVDMAWYALLRSMRLARYAHVPLPTGRRRDPLVNIVPGLVPALLLLDPVTQTSKRGSSQR